MTKSRSSSWLVPLRTGTWANRPAASAAPIGSVRTLPSTTPGIPMKLGCHQVRDRQVAQAGCGLVRAARLGRERLAGGLGVARGCWLSAKDPLSMIAFWKSPRAPVETIWARTDRPPADWPAIAHVVRVAAELADVVLHPAQRRLLVHQPVVAGRATRPRRQRRVGEEAERAEPVVDRDDDGAVRRESGAVVVAAALLGQPAAVDPHQHRQAIAATAARQPMVCVTAGQPGRVHVEVQAVLAHRPGRRERARRLRAARRELGGVADAPPRGRGLRGAPPQVAGGRRGVGNAEKLIDGACGHAADGAVAGGHDRGAAGTPGRGRGARRGSGGAGCGEGQRGQRRAAGGRRPGAPPVASCS